MKKKKALEIHIVYEDGESEVLFDVTVRDYEGYSRAIWTPNQAAALNGENNVSIE